MESQQKPMQTWTPRQIRLASKTPSFKESFSLYPKPLARWCFIGGGYCLNGAECRQSTSNLPWSWLESLPCEILHNVLENLDIKSLVTIASVNTRLHCFVRYMPVILKVRSCNQISQVFMALLHCNTARYFTIHDFKNALTKPPCAICRQDNEFGTFANLLTCQRVCYNCASSERMPFLIGVNFAMEMFQFGLADLERRGVSGITTRIQRIERLPIQPPSTVPHYRIRRTRFDMAALQPIIEMAVEICNETNRGGAAGLKEELKIFLCTTNWRRHYDDEEIHGVVDLAPNVSIAGVLEAIDMCWPKNRTVAIQFNLLGLLPYLRSIGGWVRTDMGRRCDGCARNAMYTPTDESYEDCHRVYTEGQFLHHVDGCETAIKVMNRQVLTTAAESDLNWAIGKELYRPWPLGVPWEVRDAINEINGDGFLTPAAVTERYHEVRRMIARVREESNLPSSDLLE